MCSTVVRVFVLSTLFLYGYGATQDSQHKLNTVEDVLSEPNGGLVDKGTSASSKNAQSLSESSTTFNGINVPPMKELSGQDFDEETKHGYW